MAPVGDASFKREARFTASPSTVKSRFTAPPTRPARTSPELIPTCRPIGTASAPSSFRRAMWLRISIAALTACLGASSSAAGAPKTAMMQSPMYLSTKPP